MDDYFDLGRFSRPITTFHPVHGERSIRLITTQRSIVFAVLFDCNAAVRCFLQPEPSRPENYDDVHYLKRS